MSLWRKRGTGDTNRDTIAPNVHHSEQKPDHLVNILNKLHNENVRLGLYEGVYDLSIKSEDLSIKREKAMREVQRLGQEIQGEHMIWVDPPEGWKFGFPAIYDPEKDGQMSDWIISKGYPIQIIKEYGEQWMVRCWPAEEPR